MTDKRKILQHLPDLIKIVAKTLFAPITPSDSSFLNCSPGQLKEGVVGKKKHDFSFACIASMFWEL